MKKLLVSIIALVISTVWINAQGSECVRKANFGTSKICLAKIDGYEECYKDSIVKQLADNTEVQANTILGFYLNDNIYDKRDSIGLISFDDYFKVYGTKQLQDYKADSALLDQMLQLVSENFVTKNWDEISTEIGKIGIELEVGAPIVIENYRLNDKSFTLVMLTKYDFEGIEPYTLAMTINGYLKNEKLIWMAYYLNYKDQKTIDNLKVKSDHILERLINSTE